MANRLDQIIAQKRDELLHLQETVNAYPEHPINNMLLKENNRSKRDFLAALTQPKLAVIAEIKRRSPSKGDLAAIADPVNLAQQYVQGGAQAISILTDQKFFSGSLQDLQQVDQAMQKGIIPATPILRKDFIIDRLQILEAVAAGADAVLLIVAVLGKKTQQLLEQVHALGIHALVEVHNEQEIALAVASGAQIIGVNNRNLTDFTIHTQHALNLVEKIPKNIIKIAESGILDAQLARDYHAAGYDAVLVGEALVKATDPVAFIRACMSASPKG